MRHSSTLEQLQNSNQTLIEELKQHQRNGCNIQIQSSLQVI